jgi:LuxR family transcriptional regulator, maltose regulon positive regulatory protein
VCEQSLGSSDDPSVQQVVMTSGLAWVACVEGQLTEAEHLAAQALASAASIGLAGHPIIEGALRAQGRVAFERGDLAAAERLFEQSISISEDVRPAFALVSQLLLARVWLADGRVGDALDGVTRARAFLPPDSTSPLFGLCDALEGRIAIEIGDLNRAEESAQRLKPANRASILQTRIGIARAKFDQADEALARYVPVTMREHLDVTVLAARIACGRRSDDADTLLAAAIEAAKVEGFVVAITDDLADVRSRVARLLRSRHIGTYEQAVLDRLEGHLPPVKAHGGDAGPLSDRELTVARYLASRLTMKEIAAEIFVSTNTIKTHVKRIYQKLGVSSRMEAVTEARRLGVL